MTQYDKLKSIFKQLQVAHRNGEDIKDLWQQFENVARNEHEGASGPLNALKTSLDDVIGERTKDSLRILDHGCGSGLKALYVAAIGYSNIYGVNVNDEVEWLNDITRQIFGFTEPHFFTITGDELPFPSDSFDMIMSCQVLEHVQDQHIESYYSEEARVLVAGGHAFHEVPHSFTPYDSHSRLWCAHWFPPFLRPLAYGALKSIQQKKNHLKNGRVYAEQFCGIYVRTRSPFYHRRMLMKHFGDYRDLTKQRLLAHHDWHDYDVDGSLRTRKIVDSLVKLPLVGGGFVSIFSNLMMLQTLATKKN